MALFKIFKGNETAKLVDSNATGYRVPTDGYAYYDTSTKLFYIDADYDGNGTIKRYPINAASAWSDSLGNVIKDTYLPLAGGTMTGQIKTSFKSSVAMGTYYSSQTTIPNLIDEVRYSSGCGGSVNTTEAYTLNNVTIPAGWYNFFYIPHRSGGINGVAHDDNCNYGVLYLHRMNGNDYQNYIISFSSSAIQKVTLTSNFKTAITSGQVLISDGTTGSIKTSGFTIGVSVPSNAVFTDIKQNITLATTSKAYLTGVTTTPTSSAQALTGVADTGVYLTTTAGEISAVRHSFNVSGTEKAYMAYNNTTNAIDFIFN